MTQSQHTETDNIARDDTSDILDRQNMTISDIETLHRAMDTSIRMKNRQTFWALHEDAYELIASALEDNRIVHDRYLAKRHEAKKAA